MVKTVPNHLRSVARKCIFCGEPGLTRTHIWPEWLKNILPRDAAYTSREVLSNPESVNGLGRLLKTKKRSGDVFSQKPYLACGLCNNGWMNRFEDEVLRFVKPIILGTYEGSITSTEHDSLIGWITLMVMLAEYKSNVPKAISLEELKFFKDNLCPPETWNIFIGSCAGPRWNRGWIHHTLWTGDLPERCPGQHSITSGFPLRNLQTTTIGIGTILIHAMSGEDPYLRKDFRLFSKASGLTQLWPKPARVEPFPQRTPVFPPQRKFSDGEVDTFADAYRERLLSIAGVIREPVWG